MGLVQFMNLYGIVFIPILIAQWIGVIVLGKSERKAAWWMMLAGVSMITLGSISSTLFYVFSYLMSPGAYASSMKWMLIYSVTTMLSAFGSLFFMAGFVMYAFKARRVHERVAELEMIITAQNEQLTRQQG